MDTAGCLQSMKMPKMMGSTIITGGGAQNALFDVKVIARRLQSLVPQLKIVIIPDMGHALANLSQQIVPFLVAQSDSHLISPSR